MKILVKLAVVLLILVISAVVLLFLYADHAAKAGIESGASYALGVPTKLDGADVGILSGEFAMNGLNVANPQGFDAPHFLHLGDASVAVSFASLREETIELPHLTLNGLDLNLQRREGKSNYNVILENLKRLESGEEPSEPVEGGKKFVIKEVRITDVVAHADLLPIGGELTRVDIPIDEIILKDVGSDTDKGVLLTDLSGVIIKAVFAAIVQKGGGLIPADMLGDLTQGLGQLTSLGDMGISAAVDIGGQLEGLAGSLGAPVEQLGKELEKATEDITEGLEETLGDPIKELGELFGGDKKEEE